MDNKENSSVKQLLLDILTTSKNPDIINKIKNIYDYYDEHEDERYMIDKKFEAHRYTDKSTYFHQEKKDFRKLKLDPNTLKVLDFFIMMCSTDNFVRVNASIIADLTGLSYSTVKRAIDKLELTEYLFKVEKNKGKYAPLYEVNPERICVSKAGFHKSKNARTDIPEQAQTTFDTKEGYYSRQRVNGKGETPSYSTIVFTPATETEMETKKALKAYKANPRAYEEAEKAEKSEYAIDRAIEAKKEMEKEMKKIKLKNQIFDEVMPF